MHFIGRLRNTSLNTKVVLGLLTFAINIPFLIPIHKLPIPSFYAEFAALILALFAALCLGCFSPQKLDKFPKACAIPLGIMLAVALQFFVNNFTYESTLLISFVYAVIALNVLFTSFHLNSAVERDDLVTVFAFALICSAFLGALMGSAQFMGWWKLLPKLIAEPMEVSSSGVYGNIAQQNHYACYEALGAVAVLHIRQRGYFSKWAAVLMCGFFLFAVFLSGSRAAYVYSFLCLCIYGYSKWSLERGLIHAMKTWMTKNVWLLTMISLLFTSVIVIGVRQQIPQFDRLTHFFSSTGARFFLWEHAWKMFCKEPIWGVGIDGFAFQLTEQLSRGDQINQWGVDQFAHNVFLQVLACTGMVGAFCILFPALWQLKSRLRWDFVKSNPFAASISVILIMYSLIEQPFAYAYFVVILATFVGIHCETCWTIRLPSVGRIGLLCSCILVGGASLVSYRDYVRFERIVEARLEPYRYVDADDQLRRLNSNLWLKPMVENFSPQLFVTHSSSVAKKLELNERLIRFAPLPEGMYRHAALLAESGQIDAAKTQVRKAIINYPEFAREYSERYRLLAEIDEGHFLELHEFTKQELNILVPK